MVKRVLPLLTLLFIMSLIIVIAACSDAKKPTRNAPTTGALSTPKAAAAQKLEVPSIFTKPSEEYSYNPVGKRDPFKVYEGETVQEVALPTTPLERFDLDQMVLTAIVWGVAEPRALVAAPDGQSYIVRKDMRIGKNRGRISRITRRQLFVEEEYRDPTGKLVVRETNIEIRPEKEAKTQLSMQDE